MDISVTSEVLMNTMSFEIVESKQQTLTAQTAASTAVNPAVLYLLTLGSSQSRAKMRSILNRFARSFGFASLDDFPWCNLRSSHLVTIKSELERQGRSPATVNLILCALRGVARQAWNEELLSDHDEQVIVSVKGSRGSRLGKGRALSSLETSRLVSNCDNSGTASGVRDAAIIALGIGCGLRRNEIASMRLSQVRVEDRSISILGKGNKERRVFPPEAAWARLEEWLRLRGMDCGTTVFCVVRTHAHIHADKPLSTMSVWKIMRRRATQSGVSHFTPHDLRRTFATRMLDVGADLDTIKEAMGHSSVQTTQRYVQNKEDRVRRFASRVAI